MSSSPPSLTGKTFLLTGGTGFLGSHIVPDLLQRGASVRVLSREPPSSFFWSVCGFTGDEEEEKITPQGGKLEHIRGSILDQEDLARAIRGVDGIFHLAGMVVHSRRSKFANKVNKTNIEGTVNVLEVAAAEGCKNIVYTSTSGTVGCSHSSSVIATDTYPYCSHVVGRWPYYASKITAEKKVESAAKEGGLKVIVLRPSMMLGPGDERERSTHTLVSFLRRKIPFVPTGGISFVDVRDVSQVACISMMQLVGSLPLPQSSLDQVPQETLPEEDSSSASSSSSSSSEKSPSTSLPPPPPPPPQAEYLQSYNNNSNPKGGFCRSYLLGSYNGSLQEFFLMLEKVSGVKGPRLSGLPPKLSVNLAKVIDAYCWHFKGVHAPGIDPVKAEMACHFWNIDSARAKEHLGFTPRSPVITLADSVRYIREKQISAQSSSPFAPSWKGAQLKAKL